MASGGHAGPDRDATILRQTRPCSGRPAGAPGPVGRSRARGARAVERRACPPLLPYGLSAGRVRDIRRVRRPRSPRARLADVLMASLMAYLTRAVRLRV